MKIQIHVRLPTTPPSAHSCHQIYAKLLQSVSEGSTADVLCNDDVQRDLRLAGQASVKWKRREALPLSDSQDLWPVAACWPNSMRR